MAAMAASNFGSLRPAAASTSGGTPPNVLDHRECATPDPDTTSQSHSSITAFSLSRRRQPTTSPVASRMTSKPRTMPPNLVTTPDPSSSPSHHLLMLGLPVKRLSAGCSASGCRVDAPGLSFPTGSDTPSIQPLSDSSCAMVNPSGVMISAKGAPWSTSMRLSSRVRRVATRPPGPRPISSNVTWAPSLLNRDAAVHPATPAPSTATRGKTETI
mmetsp:Transcript_22418/g.46476  ORF Transcript_22418/g.46476 Transcript_22418/m.46476 type:complete len:214 (-) Transcript_22418:2-643(-)